MAVRRTLPIATAGSVKTRYREQVAAVCYRFVGMELEFLLVQTRGKQRWTFPKGGLEAGMTRAQAAELEAFEEAGVRGRVEEAPFAHYTRQRHGEHEPEKIFIQAYLCEVQWVGRPQEGHRNPTWFAPEKAKRRLREDRSPESGEEFVRVVDRAVTRIQRLRADAGAPLDELQRVQFEAPPEPRFHTSIEQAAFAHLVGGGERAGAVEFAVGRRVSRVLGFAQRVPLPSAKALGTGKGNR